MVSVAVLLKLVCTFLVVTGEPLEYRLSGDVVPRHYDLDIMISTDTPTYIGIVDIKIECMRPTSTIEIHRVGLRITGNVIFHDDIDDAQNEETRIDDNTEKDLIVITLQKTLNPEKFYRLQITFNGDLNLKEEGLSIYGSPWYIATNLKTRARSFFPCFDEPAMRATFSLKVFHKKGLKAVSNTAVMKDGSKLEKVTSTIIYVLGKFSSLKNRVFPRKNKEKNGVVEIKGFKMDKVDVVCDKFKQTPLMSPHQVSLVVADFNMLRIRKDVNVWFLKQSPLESYTIVNLIPSLMDFFKDYFLSGFHISKLNVIVLPQAQFSCSYGTVTVPQEVVLLPKLHMKIVTKLAHQIASQWIGGLISVKWWSDLWYSYALAEHLGNLAVAQELAVAEFSEGLAESIIFSRLEAIYNQDEKISVYKEISRPEEILIHQYTTAFTEKGPSLMRMVNNHLGDKIFKDGLIVFIIKFSNKAADHDDLWGCFTKVSLSETHEQHIAYVGDIVEGWLTNIGYSLVNVDRAVNENNQESVSVYQIHSTTAFQKRCQVLIDYITLAKYAKDVTRLIVSLNCDEKKEIFIENGELILFNEGLSGPYKVKYDDRSWDIIVNALNSPLDRNRINVLNRAQLVGDILDLAQTEKFNEFKTVLLIKYLRYESSFLPWKAARKGLKFLKQRFFRSEDYKYFEKFMNHILSIIFGITRGVFPITQEIEKTLMFIMNWSFEFGVALSPPDYFGELKQWITSSRTTSNPVPWKFRKGVYCEMLKKGDVDDWEILREYFYKCDDVRERRNILFGLSCFQFEHTTMRYLEWSTNKEEPFPSDLALKAFKNVASTKSGYELAWKFLFENPNRIYSVLPHPDTLVKYIQVLADKVTTQDELEQLKQFSKMHSKMMSIEKLEATWISGKKNIDWINKHSRNMLAAFLEV